MNPLVSFVIPCYKLGHLLSDCVKSVLAQTYQNYEILIMDNCSPDNTPDVARSFGDPRVKHIRHPTNIGHIRNYNEGITRSGGKYLWWLSADDLLRDSNVLERFVAVMEQNPQAGYAFARCVRWHRGRAENIVSWTDCGDEDGIWDGKTFLARLVEGNRIVQSAGMIRRQCLERTGLYPLDLLHAGDWYLWCILALNYDVAYLSDPMVCWREHEESLTSVFHREDAHLCISDEFAVLWKVSRQAEELGFPAIRVACLAALTRRAVQTLQQSPSAQPAAALTASEFKTILRSRVQTPRERNEVLAQTHAALDALADEKYWNRDYPGASQAYLSALRVARWSPKTWLKYVLLRTNGLGHAIRKISQQSRRTGRYA